MKEKIKLQDIEFDVQEKLDEIKKNLETQDGRSTFEPIFIIYEKQELFTSEDYSYDDSYWIDDEGNNLGDDIEKIKKNLADENDDDRILDKSEWELEDEYELKKVFVKEFPQFVQAFFTEESANKFMIQNSHRLNKPYIYVESLYRNYEMQLIRHLLMDGIKNESNS